MGAADWDRDGDVDLVVGYISGRLFFLTNESKPGKIAFGDAIPLTAAGSPVEANDAGPCLADWDGDGVEDLILGDGEGGVRLFKASRKGEKGLPDLAAPVVLVPAREGADAWKPLHADKDGRILDPRISVRAKPCVADWNDDGKPDLLVGDYASVEGPEPELNPEQKAKRDELEKLVEELSEKSSRLWAEMDARVCKEMGVEGGGIPQEREAEYEKLMEKEQAAHPEFAELEKKLEGAEEAQAPFEASHGNRGFVWVFLRK